MGVENRPQWQHEFRPAQARLADDNGAFRLIIRPLRHGRLHLPFQPETKLWPRQLPRIRAETRSRRWLVPRGTRMHLRPNPRLQPRPHPNPPIRDRPCSRNDTTRSRFPAMSLKTHLPRLHQVWTRHPIYFLTTCTNGRQPLLANAATHTILLTEWREMSARRGWRVGRYVIMPDHVHFFSAPVGASAATLAAAVGHWKTWTAHAIGRDLGFRGRFWERSFFDHLLRSAESRSEKWAYVRENPVRAGLVAKAEDWPYAGAVDFE